MTSKRVLVTGVGRGLGREIARQLIDDGNQVWGSTRDGLSDLNLAGCLKLDLSDETSIIAAGTIIAKRCQSLDILVNCAGVDARAFGGAQHARGPFDLDATTFNAVIDVNVTGPMLVTRHLLPLLRQGIEPMILNISSQLGSMQVGARMGSDTSYCVSKAALNMYSLKAADALRSEGIGVVMLHPGWVQTDMGGKDAAMSVDESARAISTTLQSLTLLDTGRFIRWDGHDHPW